MFLIDNRSSTDSRDLASTGHQTQRSVSESERQGDFFFIDAFEDDGAGEICMAVMPPAPKKQRVQVPSGLPAYLKHLWSNALLTREQEWHCFRKLNYLKYLYAKAHSKEASGSKGVENREEIEALKESIERTRNFLVESNLRLVVSIAKRHSASSSDQFDELVCVGNIAVMRAVDLFDFRRGTRFSTYAYLAIERSIFAVYRKEHRFRSVFSGQADEAIEQASGDASESDRALIEAMESTAIAESLISELDERDQQIVKARFGIDRAEKGAAFRVIAKEVNLSTTRTVQLFNRCLERMRLSAAKKRIAGV